MYSIFYTTNNIIDTISFPTFHQMMNFCLELCRDGYSELIIINHKGEMIFKDVQIEREDELVNDSSIAMRESVGANWW